MIKRTAPKGYVNVRETKLGRFILDAMDEQHVESARQFADKVGVAGSTLNALINGEEVEPSLGTLRKLARTTKKPLALILALAYPDTAGELGIPEPDMLLLARELSDIPQPIQDAIKGLIRAQQITRGINKSDQ